MPSRYEIRVRGHLDARWNASFDGLRLIHESDGSTVITGLVADQAALHGLLRKVRDVGLPLLSVTELELDQPETPRSPAVAPQPTATIHAREGETPC
jgi:hypothetical protein